MIKPEEIKASDLRLGNWIASGEVFSNTSCVGKVIEILSVDKKFEQVLCECEESFEWFFKDNYCGIPLSPAILEKCGFEKDEVSEYGGYLIDIGYGERIRIVNDEKIGWHYPLNGYRKPVTNYLHQLQNLIYSLSGTELIFKP